MPSVPNFQDGIALHQRGDLKGARAVYQAVLEGEPAHFDALHLLGVLSLQTGDAAQAVELIGRALAAHAPRPEHADATVNLGHALKALGRTGDALSAYERASLLNPRHADAHYSRANLLRTRGDLAGARLGFETALGLRPRDAQAAFGLGLTLVDLGETDAAIAALETARAAGMVTAELDKHLALAMGRAGRAEEAIARFSAVIAARPNDAAAYNNRAVLRAGLRRDKEAFEDFAKAIALKPDFAVAYRGRGLARRVAGDLDGAVADFTQAAALDPQSAKVLYTLATGLAEQSRHEDASAAFARAYARDPEYPYLLGTWLHVRMLLCDWRDFAADTAKLEQMIARGQKAVPSFALPAISDDVDLERKAAEAWAAEVGAAEPRAAAPPMKAHEKIRVGYFSADFRMHPVAQLMAGVFEQHDRSRFEVTAFAFGPDSKDDMRRRLEAGFERFLDVRDKSDAEVARLARDLEIDIAVDLTGSTGGSRPGIFAARAAAVQVNYLGFPAAGDVSYIDYLIADPVLIPAQARAHYREKIVYLPSFQANDDQRTIDAKPFERTALGLPAAGVVFICLNNPFKITPEVFARWMRILARAPGSCLLLAASGGAAANLKREAERYGVDPARVIIGRKVDTPEYWARLRAADLFLDTAPFNAHSSASDALRAGLPVLTCPGRNCIGRMAASLLTAVDLPELIAPTGQAYEDLAVALAADTARLQAIRDKLAHNIATTRLFDTRRFTRTLEAAYLEMAQRARAGQPPEDIFIDQP